MLFVRNNMTFSILTGYCTPNVVASQCPIQAGKNTTLLTSHETQVIGLVLPRDTLRKGNYHSTPNSVAYCEQLRFLTISLWFNQPYVSLLYCSLFCAQVKTNHFSSDSIRISQQLPIAREIINSSSLGATLTHTIGTKKVLTSGSVYC